MASANAVSMLTRLQGSIPSRGAAAAEAATAPSTRLPPALWAEYLRVPATPPSAAMGEPTSLARVRDRVDCGMRAWLGCSCRLVATRNILPQAMAGWCKTSLLDVCCMRSTSSPRLTCPSNDGLILCRHTLAMRVEALSMLVLQVEGGEKCEARLVVEGTRGQGRDVWGEKGKVSASTNRR